MESAAKLAHRAWGKRVRQARRDAGLTQEQLAARVEVEQNTVSRIETGTTAPSDDLKLKICIALNRDVDDLFGWPESILEIARSRSAA